ncbi:hypothetical protein [Streptomyces resistomycificus]|uniref:Lipoprotein n=2 Tax=Streptomyces resistomycificus TaxID=67356 RepID=A0A0L8LNX9_9ACTN|nr:hypothetical protein [Streptomyces resistomycificus]KOG39841.1 hypothetical protein ADK37_08565 [Streptomyces resistomycificus]KUO00883.1 hypothetical protein AQJ84_07845 [Streptomyces resistomycificus]
MRVRRGRLPAVAVAAVMGVLQAVVACAGPGTVVDEADGKSASPPGVRFDAEVALADGRRVGLSYAAGRGLLERHRDAGSATWSEPHVVYGTRADPCQSMTAKAFEDTVAVIADWGPYCSDGEPPMESVAAVGTGKDLSRWDTDLTKEFDGWEKVTADGDSRQLLFTRVSTQWLTRLRWSRTEGFAEVEEVPR